MTDLVTDAAIDAAISAASGQQHYYQNLGVEPEFTMLAGVSVRAAAPLIAAEALRQVASEQRKQYAANLIDQITAMWLEARADELERDAAFTDMVQLGQELEGE